MNEIQFFNHAEFGTIRTMQDEKGEPWFVGADIANMLGYTNPRKAIRDHVEEEDKTRNDSFLVNGTSPILINESGLYALILSSKLPTAREFKHWVTSEVLPSIRKQGGYMVARPEESDEVIMARAMLIMHATLQRKEEQIARLQPRAEYADHVLDSVSCFTTTQVAKGMGMTAQELNRLLCLHGIQYGQSGQYMLYAPYARQGLATNRIHSYHDMFGAVHTTSSLVWTERGREFIYQLFNN
ncbi:MAG: phage antirepressor KilAC domain-containing protein [Bacteroidaceae bacterium]|nr:phage antirepressor KilAC domain-containing protein [Bacteroidaceae bacterium]